MKRSTIILTLIMNAVLACSAFAEFKITADDAEAFDLFGYSISMSGDYAIVGAIGNDDDGNGSGSAYIFVRDGEEWTQQQKLTADDAAEDDWFGLSVSISGDYAIVGAHGNDDDGGLSGSAYIFVRDGNEWTEQVKLTANDAAAGDCFGNSVSISDDYAIIGARYNDDDGRDSGSAYIFVRDGDEWTEQQKLTADDAAEDDYFAWSVSISGDFAIVGARLDDDDGDNSGSAYIFVRDCDEWTQQAKLTADDADAGDVFGSSVSMSGDYALVGAPYNDDDGDLSGSAYIFFRNGEEWTQLKLTADDAEAGNYFGWSVSISGDYAIIGAKGNDRTSGSAYLCSFINPDIVVSHDMLNFGTVRLFVSEDLNITIRNEGINELIVSDITVTGEYFSVNFEDEITIERNASHELTVTFAPEEMGDYSGELTITSNDPVEEEVTVELHGIGDTDSPDIGVSIEELDFGMVQIFECKDSIITISNEGINDLLLSDITIIGDYFRTDFEDAISIERNSSHELTVTFAPEEVGDFNGTLTIISNDPDEEEVTVELHGIWDTEVKFTRIEFYENMEAPDSNPDNLIDTGQNIRFKVLVVNELNRNILMGHGTIESRTEGVEVVNASASYNNILSDQAEWSISEFEVAVADDFEPGELASFRLTVENEVEPEGPWISNFSFPVAPLLMTGRILMDDDDNPDSNGDDDNIAEPGEIIEVIPLINNASPDIWHQVSGQLRFAGHGDFITVWDDVEGASGTVLDTWRYNFIDHQQQPIQPDDENIQPEEDFVFEYSEDARWASELPFDLVISGYYNEAAGDEWDEGGVLMKWSSRFVINEGLSVPNTEDRLPTKFSLSEPYPNPFNAVTNIRYGLPYSTHVSIGIYDVTGRMIDELYNGDGEAGFQSVLWNAEDFRSGVYLVRLKASSGFSKVQKVMLIR